MKALWHTKTLFIQWWKYKWSFKFDHCTVCGTCDFPHKGRWLCTRCMDKERAKNPKRREALRKAGEKWHTTNYVRIPREQWKPMWPKPTGFNQKEYQKEWYQKWKWAIIPLTKWREWAKKWVRLPLYKWHPIPFDIWPRGKEESYEKYKERMQKFDMIKSFIDK